MDKYGYIGIETLLNFCENSKDHSVTPNDFMRMKRVRMPERKEGKWIWRLADNGWADHICSKCGWTKNTDIHVHLDYDFCPKCGSRNRYGKEE